MRADTQGAAIRVAYLVNQYPSVSHTFIRREIEALERRGVDVSRFSVRRSRDDFTSPEDRAESECTRYIIGAPVFGLFSAAVNRMVRAPLRVARAFLDAMRLARRSDAGLIRHVIYFVEAVVLADWMARARIRHVHAHFGTNSSTVAMLAADIARAGFSMTVHGPEEFDRARAIGLAEKIARAQFVAAVSSFGVSQLRRFSSPADWGKIVIVRCGIEPDFHLGSEQVPPPTDPVFVCVGRLAEQKGHPTLLDALQILSERNRPCRVQLIGDGPMRAQLERQAQEAGVADRLEFLGWREPKGVREAILNAIALVAPSYAEGLPVVIMEAFSLRRPVVSTFVAGIPELVIPGENGWLAPAGAAAALADALEQAMDAGPAQRAALGDAGRRRVLERHDADREAEKLCARFVQLVGARG